MVDETGKLGFNEVMEETLPPKENSVNSYLEALHACVYNHGEASLVPYSFQVNFAIRCLKPTL